MFDRSLAPEPNSKITFKLPEIKKFELSNRLQVSFIGKNTLPIVQLGLIISAGSKYDPSDKKGLANLTSMLLDEGAGELSALELDNEFEMLGTIFSVSADQDSIFVSLLTLKENLERSLELFAKVITSPRFAEEDFQREQKKTLSKIIQLKDEPSYIASVAFDNLVCKNTPYAYPTIGYERSVASITNEDVRNFYKNYFTIDNSALMVAGDILMPEMKRLLEKYLSGWNNHKKASYGIFPLRNDSRKFYFIHKEDAAQSEIRGGHTSKGRNAEDYFETLIMNSVFGGQFTSRINLNLREKRGFTYGAHSAYIYNKEFGYFEIETSVHSKNTGESVAELLKEIEGIREEIKPEEIDFAKSALIKRYPALFETYAQMVKNMTLLNLYKLPGDYFDKYISKIENATYESVLAAARNNINPDKMIYLIVGDRREVLPQLKEVINEPVIEVDIYGNVIP